MSKISEVIVGGNMLELPADGSTTIIGDTSADSPNMVLAPDGVTLRKGTEELASFGINSVKIGRVANVDIPLRGNLLRCYGGKQE